MTTSLEPKPGDAACESSVAFGHPDEPVAGILARPPAASDRGTAVIFLHGWGGYRIGPHRLFVDAARRWAADGYSSLRFDFRGRGDSGGAAEDASIGRMVEDAGAAVAFVRSACQPRRIVLAGVCSGAKVAMGACRADGRVDALVLWSAEAMAGAAQAERKARRSASVLRTYARKLLQPATWAKILSFRVNTHLVGRALAGRAAAGSSEVREDQSILREFAGFRGHVLFVYGGADPEAAPAMRQFEAVARQAGMPHEFHVEPGADHSFYSLAARANVLAVTERWLGGLPAARP
jgi:dienelactone hydrolase